MRHGRCRARANTAALALARRHRRGSADDVRQRRMAAQGRERGDIGAGRCICDLERPSLAVLPFADLSQSHDQEYLADGLAEEIINQLAQVPALRVVGRSSSFSFKGKNEDLRTIGQKLGVTHLLEGSVRQAGDQLRITAQLVRADDGSHLWSKTYARELRDVFAVQDEISRDVAQALSVKLDVVTFNREQGGTTNVEAYERFLRWRRIVMLELFDFEHDRERLQLAREMVALDPQCVLCQDALASSLNCGGAGSRWRASRTVARGRPGGPRAHRPDRAGQLGGEARPIQQVVARGQACRGHRPGEGDRGYGADHQGARLGLRVHDLRHGLSERHHRAGRTGARGRADGALPFTRPAVRLHRRAPLCRRRGRVPARPENGREPTGASTTLPSFAKWRASGPAVLRNCEACTASCWNTAISTRRFSATWARS